MTTASLSETQRVRVGKGANPTVGLISTAITHRKRNTNRKMPAGQVRFSGAAGNLEPFTVEKGRNIERQRDNPAKSRGKLAGSIPKSKAY